MDEALTRACYSGPAGTEGVGVCSGGTQTCNAGDWGTCAGEVTPAAETCDAQDNNCDGQVDEALTRACYDGPGGTEGVGVCLGGSQTCAVGSWGTCSGQTLPELEFCDGSDNNCNGSADENVTRYSQNGNNQPTTPVYRPVDIIFVVDNSGSMTDEIVAVQNNINQSFAQIIDQSGLDYRVIMLSKHGKASTDQSICVSQPLSGNAQCVNPTTCPTNGPRFFHYSTEIGSRDSFEKIIATWDQTDGCGKAPGGWRHWLRNDSVKVFIEITDDQPRTSWPFNGMNASQFDTALRAKSPLHFGTAQQRNYIFHSIVGLKENSPTVEPWLPTQPLVTAQCTGNGGRVENAGTEYQKVSQWTGGLRFPICQYQSFDAIFEAVAEGVIAGAQMSCAFQAPPVPADSSLQNAYLELIPTNGGATVPLLQVASESACTSNSFYVVGTQIHLCEAACTLWRDDPTALLDVLYTCQSQVQP